MRPGDEDGGLGRPLGGEAQPGIGHGNLLHALLHAAMQAGGLGGSASADGGLGTDLVRGGLVRDRIDDAALLEIDHEARVDPARSEEHTSELQSLMRISYAVFCLKKKKEHTYKQQQHHNIEYYMYTCTRQKPHKHTYT